MRCLLATLCSIAAFGQSYPPAPGSPGSTAVPYNSTAIVAWATGVQVTRGYVNSANPSQVAAGSNYATAGLPEYAIGAANGASVSLGDGGSATLTFARPIVNGPGFDFAVFETGAADFIELAFVEVSSDGTTFFRFPSHSQTQTDTQIDTFGTPYPQYLNNLAGKYGGEYGTPFDLNDLPDSPLLDKNNITHIKVIDVVGSIDPAYATYDSFGNAVNDSFPTPFSSSGFDLQGIGVIHQKTLGLKENRLAGLLVYPNPASDYIHITGVDNPEIVLYNIQGKKVAEYKSARGQVDVSSLPQGIYILQVISGDEQARFKIIKQ